MYRRDGPAGVEVISLWFMGTAGFIGPKPQRQLIFAGIMADVVLEGLIGVISTSVDPSLILFVRLEPVFGELAGENQVCVLCSTQKNDIVVSRRPEIFRRIKNAEHKQKHQWLFTKRGSSTFLCSRATGWCDKSG